MVDPVEGGSPFRIEGQGNYRAVNTHPLSAFGWQESDVHMCLDLGLSNTVVLGKSQQRDEVLGKWTGDALCTFAMTQLTLGYVSRQQVRDPLFEVFKTLFQCGDAALYKVRGLSWQMSWPENFQITDGDFTAVWFRIACHQFACLDGALNGFAAHTATARSFLDADIFAFDHFTSSFLSEMLSKAYTMS
jgi:hypothetical protein